MRLISVPVALFITLRARERSVYRVVQSEDSFLLVALQNFATEFLRCHRKRYRTTSRLFRGSAVKFDALRTRSSLDPPSLAFGCTVSELVFERACTLNLAYYCGVDPGPVLEVKIVEETVARSMKVSFRKNWETESLSLIPSLESRCASPPSLFLPSSQLSLLLRLPLLPRALPPVFAQK